MRIFLTGATGFIGRAVARELVDAGHRVTGLARSETSATMLEQMGIGACRGDLSDPESLVAGARVCDGVVHTAFVHDFLNPAEAAETDRRALKAMLDELLGSDRPLVAASVTALLAPGRIGTEEDSPAIGSVDYPRSASERELLDAAAAGVRSVVVRLPPCVHGAEDDGFLAMLLDIARRTGVSAFMKEGENRWPAVHRLDVARLFRQAVEGGLSGVCLHAVAEEGITMHSIAETIGDCVGVPIVGLDVHEGGKHFGWLANYVAMDNPCTGIVTRRTTGWIPKERGLLDDLRSDSYV